MMMFIATYAYTEWCDGRSSGTSYIKAKTLEELREQMARTHFEAIEEDPDYNRTYNWKIYHFVEAIDIKSLPEFLAMVQARTDAEEERIASEAKAEEEERIATEEKTRQWEIDTYNRLKAKFEGKDE